MIVEYYHLQIFAQLGRNTFIFKFTFSNTQSVNAGSFKPPHFETNTTVLKVGQMIHSL